MKVASLVGLLAALQVTHAVEDVPNVILVNALRAQVQEVDGRKRYLVENCVVETSTSISIVSQVSDSEGARRLGGVSTCIVEVTMSATMSATTSGTGSIATGDRASPPELIPEPNPFLGSDRVGKMGKVPTAKKTKGPKTKGPKATKCPGKTKGPKTKGPKGPKRGRRERNLKGNKTKGPKLTKCPGKTKGPKTKGPKGPKAGR